MKLKAFEAVFIVICFCSSIVAVVSVYVIRERSAVSELTVSFADSTEKDEYDVTVINAATLEDFMRVSGIGEVKAGDIIAYRTAVGGFKRVVQLKDVNGISDTLYQKIIEYFFFADREPQVTTAPQTADEELSTVPTQEAQKDTQDTSSSSSSTTAKSETKRVETTSTADTEAIVTEKVMHMIDINSADAEEIADALMIDIELAQEIVTLREKIRSFSAVQELDLCDGMTKDIYARIKDYVVIG